MSSGSTGYLTVSAQPVHSRSSASYLSDVERTTLSRALKSQVVEFHCTGCCCTALLTEGTKCAEKCDSSEEKSVQ